MPAAGIMIRKLFILGLVLAVCLELSQGKPSLQAKTMEDYVKALTKIQGMSMHGEYNRISLRRILIIHCNWMLEV